ncbi:IS110 family transposase [Chloroflexi bacterium TSY]|nr:IS110 family transposase [Chloroflexi bacterium TSY]
MKVKMGIDWSEKKHDVMMLDETGRALGYAQIEHSQKGFRQIEEMRKKTGASHDEVTVGLETAHNLLIDYLWSSGYKNVYVVPPNVVNKSRERYSQSGAHNDKSDAYVIADLLRTDVHRFYPWSPGSELLQQMRVVSSATQYWTKETVALSNRLRACLLRYHPALLEVFSNWPSRIACHLVLTYPTPEHVRNSTYEGFQEFLKQHRHTQPRKWVTCYDKLTATYPTSAPAFVPAYQREALQLAECLLFALRYEQETLDQLQSLFLQHPDQHIFASLPGAGQLLAPSLLVKFGEDRKRFPSPMSLQSLAGTCPVTKQSGKVRTVHFRRACDHDFRYFTQQFARCSRKESSWAAAFYTAARQRGLKKSHADRTLANRWICIIWKLWQDKKPYDESFHLQQRAHRRQPIA